LPVSRSTIGGSPYLGVYVRAGESVALVPPSVPAQLERDIERLFGVTTVRTTVFDSEIVGALVAFNSHGAVVGDELDDHEAGRLAAVGPIASIPVKLNAMGNNVLANDRGALVHPEFPDRVVEEIGRALGVPARRGTVAGLGTVGMAAIATNRGVVVHPRATPREAELVGEALGVPVHRSTANFGVPVVGACLVANSRAILVGRPTTPVEIVHLQEGLGVLD
jgi:translation initiation factor 6